MITGLIGKYTGYMHTAFYVMCTLYTIFWIPTVPLAELLIWLVGSNLLIGYLISGFHTALINLGNRIGLSRQ